MDYQTGMNVFLKFAAGKNPEGNPVNTAMETDVLYEKLKEAWSNQNLTRLTVTLIGLYKEEQFGTLGRIASMISEVVGITVDSEARYFPVLMKLYHPDRGHYHRKEIDRLAAENDYEGLLKYAHILLLGEIDEIAATYASMEDIDYSPIYEWDLQSDGFSIINEPAERTEVKTTDRRRSCPSLTFYDAVKIRMYGKTRVELPVWYLEDLEEFELSGSGINDLDGVQYCIHAVIIDLSENAITDITPLWGLSQLEEVNLSYNRLEDIDTLSNLSRLKVVDLSNNPVKDISALMNLEKLEWVNLSGTRTTHEQRKELEKSGATVVWP